MNKIRAGFAFCGSFCTFSQVINELEGLIEADFDITPIMSGIACTTDTRFGKASDFVEQIETICNHKIISTIPQAEPIGPKKLLDILIVAPCTGNTLGKIANGITDSSVTMAVKSHLRNARPTLIAVSTNDALGASAKNIGQLLTARNIYFVPMSQDDPTNKPASLVANFSILKEAALAALKGIQIQPIYS